MEKAQLVIGANGCLGRALTAGLAENGYWTRVMVRDAMKFRDIYGDSDLDLRKGDAGNPDHLERALQEVGTVFFCALPSAENPHYIDVSRQNFRTLLDCAVGKNLHIILPGCFEVYGPPIGGAMSEDHPLEPLTACGKAQRKLEADAALWRKVHGLKITILRFPRLIGPGLVSDPLPMVISQLVSGENITAINHGSASGEWLTSAGAARAMMLCIENKDLTDNVWNVPGTKIKWRDIYTLIIDIAGVKARTRNLPLWMARFAAGGNEKLLSALYQYRFDTLLDSTRFLETTGFKCDNDISWSLRQMIEGNVKTE
jgi:nucleoside-diphosphate-sugar epimerase